MKFTAAGDAIIQRRIPENFEGYKELSPYINYGDAKFFNFETTLNESGSCCASQLSGGTYLRAPEGCAQDIKRFGFNMTSFNNNHALDFSYKGLLNTLRVLDESGFVHAGVGKSLGEAAAPKYLETEHARVALISVNTSFNPSMQAGEQTGRVPGRAGINGLFVDTYMQVTSAELEFIKDLAARTMINAGYDIESREGYHPVRPENEGALGNLKFVLGEASKCVMEIKKADLERVKKSIFEAKLQADYIMVSVHSHQIEGLQKENVPEFLREFAHFCIDEGANAVIGHGPHLLRPIEVYKDSPIFYSLGDFILELYSVEYAPAEFFSRYGMASDKTVHELLAKRSKNFTVGLMQDRKMFLTVIPMWECEGARLKKMQLLPVELVMEGNRSEVGLPRIAPPEAVLSYLSEMSKPYGLKLSVAKDGKLIDCEW